MKTDNLYGQNLTKIASGSPRSDKSRTKLNIKPLATTDNIPQSKKEDNGKDTESGKRFSLKESIEETKDLIAVQNLTGEKLRKLLDLQGIPMPSITITKSDATAEDFGRGFRWHSGKIPLIRQTKQTRCMTQTHGRRCFPCWKKRNTAKQERFWMNWRGPYRHRPKAEKMPKDLWGKTPCRQTRKRDTEVQSCGSVQFSFRK